MYISLYTPYHHIVVPIIFLQENRFLYQELKCLFQLYVKDNDASKIQLITRSGTGTAGSSSSPFSITFKFTPTIIVCLGYYTGINYYFPFSGSTNGNTNNAISLSQVSTSFTELKALRGSDYNGHPKSYYKKSSDGKILYWYYGDYFSDYKYYTINASGCTYYFIGIA